ncbi:fumarylacetoacetate hydrolase family protein [Catenulispora sp. NF23]|uniref:fumarylacetoacetate hydrolase family protein n=1 Tax=Catenulispora pinistramenti TaxID=2705254 RepID=UPI001BA61BBF|nr:fumarylacetoacetate hydrolase family protein [Catenulispora pinistramenti]MBS2531234.1 fumarylacetoacetate hydrolase family protein [Catenulispora pinistramenti]
MRLTRIDDRACVQVGEQHYDIARLSGQQLPSELDVLVRHELLPQVAALATRAPDHDDAVLNGQVGPPIRRPGTIFGWGLNFGDHTTQSGLAQDELPTLFVKFPSAVTGPYDPIVIPQGCDQVDWEAELAIVIGKPGRHITRGDAMSHVAGLMCAQDVSERHVQLNAGTQFCLGKGFDTFCPWGPALVTLDELPDLASLEISCRLNGELVQRASVGEMLCDVAELITRLSRFTTLRAGDVILGGSPGGVGLFQTPPRFLANGDVLETAIMGIGSLLNHVTDENHADQQPS